MFKNLVTVLFFVQDIRKSKEWYSQLLGIAPIEEDSKFASFRIENHFLNFHLADNKSPVSSGGCVCYWEVTDLHRAIEKAKSLGAKVYRGPLEVSETGRTICQIKDPFGNVFGLET